MFKKIAIIGGSFNPPTIGHKMLAEFVSCYFDEVWLMPCFNHMQKSSLASSTHRLSMLNKINFNSFNIKISTFEIGLKLDGKTSVLMNELKKYYFNCTFYNVIGSDVANNIESFYDYENLLLNNNFCIIERKGFNFDKKELFSINENNMFLSNDDFIPEISSSYIRDNIFNNDILNKFLPLEVIHYIKTNNLYE